VSTPVVTQVETHGVTGQKTIQQFAEVFSV
jgi:hypothetical protein